MRAKRINFSTVRSDTVLMRGGLNENISSLELKGGELTAVSNYEMVEGSKGGYSSIQGYERYDGTELASEVAAIEGDDTAREARRDAILEVPGSGPILGLYFYEGNLYAFRNTLDGLAAKMHYASDGGGWIEMNLGDPLLPNGNYRFSNYIYADQPQNLLYFVDGVNTPRVFNKFDNTLTTIVTGETGGYQPHELATHNERLFLAYPNGNLISSTLGNPLDWGTSPDYIVVGNEITSLRAGVGNSLVVFCDEAIFMLNGTQDRETWAMDKFSDSSGGYTNTTARLFGTIFFMDDRGVTSLASVDAFGDVASNSISQKVYKTLQEYKGWTTVGVAARDKNQYRLFFGNALGEGPNFGIYFSFNNKQLRGVTLVEFNHSVITAYEGEDKYGTNVVFFGSKDGMVYKMDSGTSFDGEEIETLMSTAFYHYGSPRNWKKFHSIVAEINTVNEIDLQLRTLFDYGESHLPRTSRIEAILRGNGGVWGEGNWGEMTYSAGLGTSRLKYYTPGLASNMSLEVTTSEKYAKPHTVQNMITDYELSRRQL